MQCYMDTDQAMMTMLFAAGYSPVQVAQVAAAFSAAGEGGAGTRMDHH
jgi:hypothetical protein